MSIELCEITKSFNNKIVLNHLDIKFKDKHITCIMGPSGGGKTTLLHIIMGILKADDGNIKGITGKKITAVFQEDRLCESIDAVNNVLLVCDKKVSAEEVKKEFREVNLTDYEGKPTIELSGGMKRRVAIVRALLPESDIIIMDEPFKGLDEELKIKVIEYVKKKAVGKTVLMVTHDKEEAEALKAEIVSLGN